MPFAGRITVAGFENVLLNFGSGGNTFQVQGTAAGTAVRVNAGAGNDTIALGSAGGPPDAFAGPLWALRES
jgi:hypothetical protein